MKIACIDPFDNKIVQIIRNNLPSDWSLALAESQSDESKIAVLADADVCFLMAAPLTQKLLEHADKLRFVQKLGAGLDRIDLDVCKKRKIRVAKLFAGNSVPVAEHTLMLMLSASRQLVWLDQQTRLGAWDKESVRGVNQQLSGKTVGIIGFGAIGRQVSQLLSGFGVRKLYFDPMRASAGDESEHKIEYQDLDNLIEQSDLISLHIPLLESTRGIIDATRISKMKKNAILVNCARGGLVDEQALYEALENRRIFAAGIDAFPQEPPGDSLLLKSRFVTVTPHCAGATVDNFDAVAKRAVANTQKVFRSEILPIGDEEILWS